MSDVTQTKETLLRILADFAVGEDCDCDALTKDLQRALVEFGSQTPNNLSCACHVEFGRVGDRAGLMVRNSGLLMEELAHALEDQPIPTGMKQLHGNLTQEDWDAFTRLTTLIYALFSRGVTG